MKNKLFKRVLALVAAGVLALNCVPVSVNAEEREPLTGKDAFEITQMMEKGWNMGNTFDATGGNKNDIYSQETSWGNPKVTKELIEGVKAAGFTTIRIPITWARFVDTDNNYAIAPEFMERIREIVTYAYDAGLFIIINVHHESWVNRSDIDTSYPAIGDELVGVWRQVAEEFADFDQHLIFEGMNEPRAQGTSYEWNGTPACYDAINVLNQRFVETVRANKKGYNGERILMIPGYAASSNPAVLRSITIPEINGAPAENIAISVHCYSPYEFCLTDKQVTFDPEKSSDTADINQLLKNIKTLFLDKGIPAVIGECGCTDSKGNIDARRAWFAYFGNITSEYGVPAVVWDNGSRQSTGGECHRYIDRKTGECAAPELVSAFLEGNYKYGPAELTNMFITFETEVRDGEKVLITPDVVGFTPTKLTTQMKINHTEGAAMGFSLKVEPKVDDFTARLDISRYAGQHIEVSAWVMSEAGDKVSVGITGGETVEYASMDAYSEWSQVSFACDVPEGKKWFVYFKGTENTFYVDDISVSFGDDADNQGGETVSDTSTTSSDSVVTTDKGTSEVKPGDENSSDTVQATDVPGMTAESDKSVSTLGIVMIVTAVIALIAAVVLVVENKKTKK